jgi:nucleoporin NUP159
MVQSTFTLFLPKWDQENDESKSLLVVGDASSIDFEIIGNIGNSWYQQSQENH